MMTLAIVMSPIPSAPIALASGALYGHTIGTIYIVIGSVLGVSIAFFITRISGIDITQKWLDKEEYKNKLNGSQNMIMLVIFISRLLPFISFDIISYAAGVTAISFWRFLVATFAGIISASFLLAHFGGELASAENQRIGITVLLISTITLVTLTIHKIYGYIQLKKK